MVVSHEAEVLQLLALCLSLFCGPRVRYPQNKRPAQLRRASLKIDRRVQARLNLFLDVHQVIPALQWCLAQANGTF